MTRAGTSSAGAYAKESLHDTIGRAHLGALQWIWANRFGLARVRRRSCDHKMVIRYQKNPCSILAALCDEHGSDKGEIKSAGHPYPWPSHTYVDFYSLLFGQRRYDVRRVFECGIGTNNPDLVSSMGQQGKPGASLRVWRDYFPNAAITGADIDRSILFKEARIDTFHVDQTDPSSVRQLWESVETESFDLMIDDGLHVYSAGLCLFENSIHKLAAGGSYVIEDVMPADVLKYQHYFADKNYQVQYVSLTRSRIMHLDNNLVVISK
jgi:hypothetical protein